MDVVWQVSREAEGRCCSALACDSVWAGGGGRTARGEARLRATRSRLLPEAFLVSALKVVNPRTPLSPAITRMVDPPTASNPQTCWSWGPRVLSGLVSQETRPRSQGRGPPTTSSAPRLHFSGGPTKQDTWLSSGLGQGLFPGQSVVKPQRAGAARGPGHPGGVKAQGCGAPRGERLNFCP